MENLIELNFLDENMTNYMLSNFTSYHIGDQHLFVQKTTNNDKLQNIIRYDDDKQYYILYANNIIKFNKLLIKYYNWYIGLIPSDIHEKINDDSDFNEIKSALIALNIIKFKI